MTANALRIILAALFFVHGIGHLQGVVVSLGLYSNERWNARSWLFTEILGETTTRTMGFFIWLTATLASLTAGLSMLDWLTPAAPWRLMALICAVISTFGLVFYWNSLAMIFNKVGAIAVNVAIVVSVVLLNWPPEGLLGF